jgi:hypothetical protein
MVDWDTREVLEAAVDEIIVLTDTTDAWIGVKTGDNGIGVFHDKKCRSVLGTV